MTKVALVGFSQHSIKHLKDLPDDFEIWTAGRGWDNPTIAAAGIDMVLEVHPRKLLEYLARKGEVGKRHYDWMLNEKHDFPVYTIEEWPEVDKGVVYPFREIVDKFMGSVVRGEEMVRPFTCTMDYLLALALYQGVEEVRIIGIEMSYDTEYYYQKPGFAFWLGVASALGVKIWMPEESMLFRPKVYHEGGQMIGRHEVERYKIGWTRMRDQAIGKYNQAIAAVEDGKARHAAGEISEEQLSSMRAAVLQARDTMMQYNGLAAAAQTFEDMFDVEDTPLEPSVMGVEDFEGVVIPNRRPRHRT